MTETLHCEKGDHDWERDTKRGKKPVNCPEHSPQKKPTLPPEERARRLRVGREKAQKERDKHGVETVKNWRAKWLKPEAQLHRKYADGELERDEFVRGLRELSLIPFPTDADWDAAKRAGIVVGDPKANEDE